MKTKLVVIIFTLSILLILFANFAFSACLTLYDEPYELRKWLREIVLNFLDDPASSPLTLPEIKDLLDFYKQEKDQYLVTGCTNTISSILGKVIKECNDEIDNDGDNLVDLSDAGCTDSSDNDETNCGDNACEGTEDFLSCSLDCGAGILIMKDVNNAISFNNKGNVILKGTLQKGTSPVSTADNEFIFRNSAGNPVAVINLVTGNMAIKGSLSENRASLTPTGNEFIIKDASGNIASYIDESGNFYLKGTLTQNGNP